MNGLDNEKELRSIASDLLKAGRLIQARDAYVQLSAGNPNCWQTQLALARIERQLANEKAACGYLRRAAELRADDLQIANELADLLRGMGETGEAAEIYQRMLAQDATSGRAHYGLGMMARARGDREAANGHFAAAAEHLRAVAMPPTNPRADIARQMHLAEVLRELGQVDEAVAIFQHILSVNKEHIAALNALAWIARGQRAYETALEYFKVVAELQPGNLHAQFQFAKTLELTGACDRAKAIYLKIIESKPDFRPVNAALAALARAQGDRAGAIAHLDRALRFDPENDSLRLERARAFAELAMWDEAEAAFRALLEVEPDHLEALLGLAEIARARDDTDAAIQMFERAAAVAPLDYRPKKPLRDLKAATGIHDWRTEIHEAVAVARAPDASTAAQIEAATTLVQFGLTAIAGPLLERLAPHSMAARQLMMAVRNLEQSGLAQPLLSEALDPAQNQLESLNGYIEKPVPGADTLVLVFGGTNHRLWLTFSLLHKVLSKLCVSVIYVRDLNRSWYTSGIVGLGDDYATSVERLAEIAARHRPKRILTLGNCAGCIGALRVALSLRASGVLALSPKLRPREWLTREQRAGIRSMFSNPQPGLKALTDRFGYMQTTQPPKITLVYGEQCADDVADASYLTGIPGAVNLPITGSDDADCVKDLLVRGLLAPMLQEFVGHGMLTPETCARICAGPKAAVADTAAVS